MTSSAASTVEASPTPTPSAAAIGTDGSIDCQILQRPGASDRPSNGGETDTAGLGPGRWRLCLSPPLQVAIEGTAWCHWNDARTEVEAVSGLPLAAGSIDYDSFLTRASVFELHATDVDQGGAITNYAPDPSFRLAGGVAMQDGFIADFEVRAATEPGTGSSPDPSILRGSLRWVCGDPPLS